MLKLNGKDFSLHKPSVSAARVKSFLGRQKPQNLFTADEVAKRCSVSLVHLGYLARHGELDGYTGRAGKERYYGNPRAIRELIRMTTEVE